MTDKEQTLEALRGKPFRLDELVQYQKDGVISRTLLNTDHGTLTVFSFDKGQALSEHSAPFDALVQILEGEVEICLGGEPHRLRKGETLIMPADIPHALKAKTPFKMILTMLRG